MGRLFSEPERERMIKVIIKYLGTTIKNDPKVHADDVSEEDFKKVLQRWLAGMEDSKLQIYYARACVIALDKELNQDE